MSTPERPSKKRPREEPTAENEERDRKRPKFTERQAAQYAKLGPPTLMFESSFKGVRTQKLNEIQSFTFHQEATLLKPQRGPAPADLYLFTQEVKDTFDTVTADGTVTASPLGEFEWDDPYGPPYEDPVITASPDAIAFTDDPGFSTDRKIPAGHWLTKYTIYFRWKVIRRTDDAEWTSPTVQHSLTCPYTDGTDASVTHQAAGKRQWTVNFGS